MMNYPPPARRSLVAAETLGNRVSQSVSQILGEAMRQ
jgi:hypothetical protein